MPPRTRSRRRTASERWSTIPIVTQTPPRRKRRNRRRSSRRSAKRTRFCRMPTRSHATTTDATLRIWSSRATLTRSRCSASSSSSRARTAVLAVVLEVPAAVAVEVAATTLHSASVKHESMEHTRERHSHVTHTPQLWSSIIQQSKTKQKHTER
uniref:(northern house mosquito) hypothetical protein n=1 Tax=Culex pipiens TaxID=7175 RepID=A0A8D8E4Z9_CULPI